MPDFEGYNMKTKQKTKILNPEIVTMENGRKAAKGVAADDGVTKVFKILSAAEIASL